MQEGSWSTTAATHELIFGDEETLWQQATKRIADDILIHCLGIKHVPDRPELN